MKKTFKTFALMLAAVLAFSSCADIPAPYNMPEKDGRTGGGSSVVAPAGDGTLASPYNVAAIVAKVKEMEAGVESTEEYYIKGKVLAVTTTEATIAQYGNHTFTMVDEGNNSTVFTAFQVYGPGKKKFTSVNDIKVGDEVVVCGKVVNFKGNTPETVGKGAAYVVSINSSGSGEGPDTSSSSKENPLTITQAKTASGSNYVKGYIVGYVDGQNVASGAVFDVPSSSETEILLAEAADETNPDNVFPVQLPAGDIRNALELSAHPEYLKKEVVLYGSLETYFGMPGMKSTSWASIDGKTFGKDPDGGSVTPPSGEAKGSGTEADPYNTIAAIQFAQSLGADVESENNVYVSGIISSIKYTYSSNFGTATYSISADGKTENEFVVYGSYYFNNQPWKDGDTQIKVGDAVVVCGKVVNYMGNTPEFANKKNWLVSINGGSGQGGDEPGPGPEPGGDAEHITVAEFLQRADENTVYELTGTVKNISNTKYGNFDLVEGDASIYIYGLLNQNGEKQKFDAIGIEEGDVVTLTGKYKLYNNKPEIADAQLVSFTKGQGGDEPGPGPEPGGDPVTDLVNGNFESWDDASQPTGWKSACTASNAELAQSTDARSGSYACVVKAPGTTNKRLATQEMTLEAGTYTFSYYAKSTTANPSQTKGGYVPVNANGSVGTYQYSKTFADLNNNDWTLVSYDFTLESATTICLIVMNPKDSDYSTSQDILVDDATLVKK